MTDTATILASVQASLDSGRRQEARGLLRPALESPESQPARVLAEIASACEGLGLVAEAIRCLRLAIEKEPRDTTTWLRLADLHDERGDPARAERCRSRARELGAVVPPARPASGDPLLAFDGADLARFVALFSGREGVHARQWLDKESGRGGWSPVREALSVAVVRRHVDGRETVGSYVVRHDDTCSFFVLDLDATREAVEAAAGDPARVEDLRSRLDRALRRIAGALGQLGLPHLLVDSGWKGRHAWVFFDEPQPAALAREVATLLARSYGPCDAELKVEAFPKQDHVGEGGLGNLVKLPVGVHLVTGRRCSILRADGRPVLDPWQALREVRRVARADLVRARDGLAARVPAAPTTPSASTASTAPYAPVAPAPAREPPFTEADLDGHPDLTPLLAGCAVLRRVVERALAGDALDHGAIVALRHTLGHLDDGPRAVNFLLDRVPGAPADARLRSVLRGSPASCANLRRRLSGISRKVDCDCDFGPVLPTYPHPLLHIDRRSRAPTAVLEEDEP